MFGLGVPELITILVIALLVFGAGKLPDIMGSIGKGIRELKKSTEESSKEKVTPGQEAEEKEPPGQAP